MKKEIEQIIKQIFETEVSVELTRPNEKFGDFSTNVALQLAGKLGQNPRDIAEKIAAELKSSSDIEEASVAGAGFINLRVKNDVLLREMIPRRPDVYGGQVVAVEYSDPNPFKVLHAGHFYTSVVGEAIANLVELAGGDVKRLNFGGDVGLHVGKSMWAIISTLGGEFPEKLEEIPVDEQADWIAKCYVEGTAAYDEDESAKAEIIACNKKVYKLQEEDDHDSDFAKIYWTCREWSYDHFKKFYARIGSDFDKFYPESSVVQRGLDEVKSRIGKVFEKSDDAIVFKGEKFGLHTRVFINRQGIPTYETKDVGLIFHKYDDWKFDRSIIITGDDQKQYMEVVLKAIEQFAPELSKATTHIIHGLVKLAGAVKMSSRKGSILRAIDVLDFAVEANRKQNETDDESIALGAVKYAFLKQRVGGDIVYDPEESVSIHGNSGPYLQYAYVRACSILNKASKTMLDVAGEVSGLDDKERSLVLKMSEFNDVLTKASEELLPHLVASYLYELAQTFNRFYESSRIIGDERQELRLQLISNYANILKEGLAVLGISAPDKM